MAVENPVIGTLFINGGPMGFSEKYHLSTVDLSSSIPVFKKLAQWRATILPRGFEIVWARVAFADTLRLSKAAIDAPLQPHDDGTPAADAAGYGVVNKIQDGLVFRYETAAGQHVSRTFRAIVDQKIEDDELVGAIDTVTAAPAVIPAGVTADYLTNFGDFLNYTITNTVHSKKLSSNPNSFELTAWEKVIFRRTGTRDTGRPFGMPAGRR